MGWRFQKRLSMGPLRVNLSRRGIGTSVGIPGLRIGQSATGRRYLTIGLPGSGLSYTKALPRSRQTRRTSSQVPPIPPAPPTAAPRATRQTTQPWWRQRYFQRRNQSPHPNAGPMNGLRRTRGERTRRDDRSAPEAGRAANRVQPKQVPSSPGGRQS
jgi:Protein of unknown function (DUF4236)